MGRRVMWRRRLGRLLCRLTLGNTRDFRDSLHQYTCIIGTRFSKEGGGGQNINDHSLDELGPKAATKSKINTTAVQTLLPFISSFRLRINMNTTMFQLVQTLSFWISSVNVFSAQS
jgi:hypothetical protein